MCQSGPARPDQSAGEPHSQDHSGNHNFAASAKTQNLFPSPSLCSTKNVNADPGRLSVLSARSQAGSPLVGRGLCKSSDLQSGNRAALRLEHSSACDCFEKVWSVMKIKAKGFWRVPKQKSLILFKLSDSSSFNRDTESQAKNWSKRYTFFGKLPNIFKNPCGSSMYWLTTKQYLGLMQRYKYLDTYSISQHIVVHVEVGCVRRAAHIRNVRCF